jgi:hypothetical protein
MGAIKASVIPPDATKGWSWVHVFETLDGKSIVEINRDAEGRYSVAEGPVGSEDIGPLSPLEEDPQEYVARRRLVWPGKQRHLRSRVDQLRRQIKNLEGLKAYSERALAPAEKVHGIALTLDEQSELDNTGQDMRSHLWKAVEAIQAAIGRADGEIPYLKEKLAEAEEVLGWQKEAAERETFARVAREAGLV